MRKQYELTKPIYTKRAGAVSKIPNFWALVLEQAPLEIDQFIQPSDSRIFGESLLNLTVTRPELDAGGPEDSPRSLKFQFEFKPNEDFEDTVLEKEFHYRRAKDGWTGLVSEPVKVHWKKGKDLTEGLGDGAVALWEARKKKGEMMAREGGEYDKLRKLVEHWNGANTSFFTWFGWVSGRRWVSAEESAAAQKEYRERMERRKKGEKVDEPEEDEEDEEKALENDDSDVEVHEAGEELAISFAEDLWPNAIKFFTQAQEMEEMSDVDFEEDDDDMEEDDDDDEGQPVDIRALVQDKGKTRKRMSDGPGPSKKAKKAS